MSEKRFIVEYGENNLPFFVDLEEHRDMSIKEVVDLLNEMFEKLNKKQEKSVELFFKYKKLQEENEQLRKQQQRLYNYFRNYLEDEMSAENFGEMWDTVKEDERWNDE